MRVPIMPRLKGTLAASLRVADRTNGRTGQQDNSGRACRSGTYSQRPHGLTCPVSGSHAGGDPIDIAQGNSRDWSAAGSFDHDDTSLQGRERLIASELERNLPR